ncbi:hypothetical protein SAMN02910275_00154 [Butyrivibrio sp. INlla18]|uniref:hypothetical protein n=1 Tax=Butyrivibrio sp. INlla18 TaxID=1520806 RepID=UPI000880DC44|nr:hypothetical protein [Butyrivibrio sp. INlla18]SDA39010.1 hypothetical protein SAMN02910275_00154 [Butyrivibrio sp. INlla18]
MGSGASGKYTGTSSQSQPYAPSYHVEPKMHQSDIDKGIYHDGKYDKNPTAKNLNEMINGNYIGNKNTNVDMPYVIDMHGNIIIGSRNGNGKNGLATPHPTLIGGKDPEVQMAGMLHIHGGKIASYDNISGHFKPNSKSMTVADEAFGKLSPRLFKKKGH